MTEEVRKILVTIDEKEIEVPEGITVLQACEIAKQEVPVFCYHPKLSIAGNCRMCLVEIENKSGPVASCAMQAMNGMKISTKSEMVKKARKGNLEFLLINHPLDCPICDQGGECDLQDITMAYGPSTSRFKDNRRAVKDKNFGPLIKTHMTRCIHCTRCVRFVNEIAGVEEIGAFNRGEDMEISPYLEQAVTSELSGNVIDLCPVGALTSKPYAFKARSWELDHTNSIDVMDAVGSHIQIDSRNNEVMRILPRACEAINEEWISDKARFSYDGLLSQRLDRPYIRVNGKLKTASWHEALVFAATEIKKHKADEIAALSGDLADVEAQFCLKELMNKIGSPHLDCRQDGAYLPTEERADYIFNTTIAGIEQADHCLIIGSNPRLEAPLINARIRKSIYHHGLQVAYIGPNVDLTYKMDVLSDKLSVLNKILSEEHAYSKVLKKAVNPMIIIGQGALSSPDGEEIYNTCRAIADKFDIVHKDWNGFNVLHMAAGRVGGLDIGFLPGEKGRNTVKILRGAARKEIKLIYLLGADEIPMNVLKDTFVIYQGSHGDKAAHIADVIFPATAYTEKDALYVNTEGRIQQVRRAVFAPGEAKEDWKIIRALSEIMQKKLPYDTREEVLERLTKLYPIFKHITVIEKGNWRKVKPTEIRRGMMTLPIDGYYQTNPIARASVTMAKCVEEKKIRKSES
jgi:NADH-quinone oxidoreductase subunit G